MPRSASLNNAIHPTPRVILEPRLSVPSEEGWLTERLLLQNLSAPLFPKRRLEHFFAAIPCAEAFGSLVLKTSVAAGHWKVRLDD